MDPVPNLTIKQLKEELKARGLGVSGNKTTLIERLRAAIRAEAKIPVTLQTTPLPPSDYPPLTGNVDSDTHILLFLFDLRAIACVNRHFAVVCRCEYLYYRKILHEFGADIIAYLRGNTYRTAYKKLAGAPGDLARLTVAATEGYLPLVDIFMSQQLDLNSIAEGHTEKPLTAASRNGHVDVVRTLLNGGARVDALDLFAAAYGGSCECVELLLDSGADIHAEHDRVILEAIEGGHLVMIRRLLEKMLPLRGIGYHASGNLALLRATRKGDPDIMKLLLDHNIGNFHGHNEAMAFAASHGDVPITGMLLDRGMHRLTMDRVLCYAAGAGRVGVTKLVLSRVIDVNSKPAIEALSSAVRKKHTGIVKLLLAQGTDFSLLDQPERDWVIGQIAQD